VLVEKLKIEKKDNLKVATKKAEEKYNKSIKKLNVELF